MPATKAALSLIAGGTAQPAFTQLTGCSATRSGTTATVTKTGHGLTTGDIILSRGWPIAEFNGVWTITVVDANTFTFVMIRDPGANPAGTPGIIDKGTRSALIDMTVDYGAVIVGEIQNGNTGPSPGAMVWVGWALAGTAEGNFLWDPVLTGSTVAGARTQIQIVPAKEHRYVRLWIGGNGGQAVDIWLEASEMTGI